MLREPISRTITLADQRTITIETGKLARHADGSVVVSMGDMMLLATVVAGAEVATPQFLPLYVEYQEKFAAAGKIPGSFLRREGRLGDHEILVSRIVDRALRPLFPEEYHAEVQINIFLISADPEVLPDALVGLAASAALAVSPTPLQTYISTVRVARIDSELVINPPQSALDQADIDLIVAASEENIIMVEGEMQEVQEAEILSAIQFAHEAIKQQCQVQQELAEAVGQPVKGSVVTAASQDNALRETLFTDLYDKIYQVAAAGSESKKQFQEALANIKQTYVEGLANIKQAHVEGLTTEELVDDALLRKYFQEVKKKAMRDLALDTGTRIDGRKLDEVRPIHIEADYLPAAHGSALFTRGETQSLTTVTLGTKLDEQLIDRVMINGYNRFMLHYNFPGFSTGEVKVNRGPARREIGHGHLAMRALKRVLPPDTENPYTIRIVSDILESNGSSSMATVCAGSLALMDTGVPVKAAVAGIAMGLIMDADTGKHAILSDILGDEDAIGDMDFKVAGTARGVTACQMDIKVAGLSYAILEEALQQSRAGRLHILSVMDKALAQPRDSYKTHAPRFGTLRIPREMIGAVIGPSGKVIQEMQRETGATIIVEEIGTEGVIKLFAPDQDSIQQAEQKIKAITAQPVVGEVYVGKVKSILPFGAFVEFMPGREGLLHISEVKLERIADLSQVLEIGEMIQIKLTDVDPKTGKYRLSRKALLLEAAATTPK
ncbi:MAG: polyribonucleotide nucleotidyltransferase [Bacteroidota bacterium]